MKQQLIASKKSRFLTRSQKTRILNKTRFRYFFIRLAYAQKNMKKVMLVVLASFLLLASCAPRAQVQETVSNSSSIVLQNETSANLSPVDAPLIQCPDGIFVSSIKECDSHAVILSVNDTFAHMLLEQSHGKFSNYAYLVDDALIIVSGNRSRYYFSQLSSVEGIPITDVYVDRSAKTAVAYCNIDREAHLSPTSFDYERSKCKGYLDAELNVSFEAWDPKGPIDFLEEFENETPILVEDNLLTISIGGNSKTIQPSLHYEKNGKEVILRIDKRYNIPAKVEIEGQPPIDFRDTYFDLMIVEGKQQRITPDWVTYQNVSAYWLKGNSK